MGIPCGPSDAVLRSAVIPRMYNEYNNVGRVSVLALRGKDIPQVRVLILALKLVVNMEEGDI